MAKIIFIDDGDKGIVIDTLDEDYIFDIYAAIPDTGFLVNKITWEVV